MPKKSSKEKKYVVIYRSQEHFEVLGFEIALSLAKAKLKAQRKLLDEAKHYNVAEAEIAELKDPNRIIFDIFH